MADAHQPMGGDVPMRTSPSGVCTKTEVPHCPSRCACVLARCVALLPVLARSRARRDTRCRCGVLAAPPAPRTFALPRPVTTHPQEIRAATWNVAAVNNNPFEYWVTHPDPGTDSYRRRVCALVCGGGPAVHSAAADRILTRCKNAAYNMLMEGVQDFIDNPGHRCVSAPACESERVHRSTYVGVCVQRNALHQCVVCRLACAAGRTYFSGKRDLASPTLQL